MQRLLLRLAAFAVGIYYRVRSLGAAVPADGPVILVGNHPNGLVDPVVLASTTTRPVRFLGKAPLFDMPVLGSVMRGLKALPVYRPKDGADTARNEETFGAVHDALRAGDLICLFPEGVSHNEPALQTLKTGAARMALGAEALCGFTLGVRIVPVGLVYRAKRRFRSEVATWVGTPIDVRDLADDWANDDREAVRRLTDRVAEGLGEVTLNLDGWEDFPVLELAERIFPADGALERVPRLKAFADGLHRLRRADAATVDELTDRIACFGARLRRLGLAPNDLERRYVAGRVASFALRSLLVLVVGLPLALIGLGLWALPYFVVPRIARRADPSRDVHATVQILAGVVLFPAWLLALAGVALWQLGLAAGLAVLVLAPPLGLVALAFRDWRAETVDEVALFFRLGRLEPLRVRLRGERDAIVREIAALRERLEASPDAPAEGAPAR